MRSHDEIKMTPRIEADIQRDAARWGSNRERLRYYVQFGMLAPSWPEPSKKARRWLRQLDRLAP